MTAEPADPDVVARRLSLINTVVAVIGGNPVWGDDATRLGYARRLAFARWLWRDHRGWHDALRERSGEQWTDGPRFTWPEGREAS